MDYDNNNYNNDNYNNDNYNNNNYNNNNDAKTYDSGNPYEQANVTGGQSPYISSDYSSPYGSQGYSSAYGQNNYQEPYGTMDTVEKEEPVSVLDWVGTLLLTMIPCAALIVYLIWAFGSNTKKSKSNYCKAYLIVALISTGIVLVFYFLMIILAFSMNY